jgi:hypothetical protein
LHLLGPEGLQAWRHIDGVRVLRLFHDRSHERAGHAAVLLCGVLRILLMLFTRPALRPGIPILLVALLMIIALELGQPLQFLHGALKLSLDLLLRRTHLANVGG